MSGNIKQMIATVFNTDRYLFDFTLCTYEKGWAQVDTEQDAPYYGTWANPFTLEFVNYCEGDVTHLKFEKAFDFYSHIKEFANWHNEVGWKFMGIDPGLRLAMWSQFIGLGMREFMHDINPDNLN